MIQILKNSQDDYNEVNETHSLMVATQYMTVGMEACKHRWSSLSLNERQLASSSGNLLYLSRLFLRATTSRQKPISEIK